MPGVSFDSEFKFSQKSINILNARSSQKVANSDLFSTFYLKISDPAAVGTWRTPRAALLAAHNGRDGLVAL